MQIFPDNDEQTYEGIDLLDPTKIVPEELVPVQPIGRLVLNANPTRCCRGATSLTRKRMAIAHLACAGKGQLS